MKYFIEDNTLTDIADAIREKTSTRAKIQTLDMADAIRSIKGTDGGIECACIDEELLVFDFCDSNDSAYEATIPDSLEYWKDVQAVCFDFGLHVYHYEEYESEDIREITSVDEITCACVDNALLVWECDEQIDIVKDFTKITVTVVEG